MSSAQGVTVRRLLGTAGGDALPFAAGVTAFVAAGAGIAVATRRRTSRTRT
ncbi:hypothetical protein [Streptomyces glomeratus]|nr:hypothetical protein [Streptomyces glomeratus]MCF1506690.1 hypothetical protein [Streptomyces glomeratus]